MEWFGITGYGVEDPFKDMIRPDYKEPIKSRNLLKLEAAGKLNRPFYEMTSQLDCYLGRVDGYPYRSNDRLQRMRKKGTFKPIGPLSIYRYPSCTSMDFGWWQGDPALKNETWYLPHTRYPQANSEHTRFIDHQLKVYKVFRM
ncbi:hypothetical protein Trydic_g8749 [Trypoxylus dichotomus]